MIDPAEVKDPSPGVQRAALMLSQESSTEATCYGWVPQARRALLAAVTVEAVLPHLPYLPAPSPFVEDWPVDEQEFWLDGDWSDFTERQQMLDLLRRQKVALAIVTALVGAP